MKRNNYLHLLPGRLRLTVPGLKKNPAMAETLGLYLAEKPGVLSSKINILTGSILIFYDEQFLDHHLIILAIEDLRQDYCLQPRTATDVFRQWPTTHVVLICIALLIVYIRFKLNGKSQTSQPDSLVDLAVFLSVLCGYPFFSKKLDHFTLPLGIEFGKFADILSLLILITKGSFEGLLISFIVSFTKLAAAVNLTKANQEISRFNRTLSRARIVNGNQERVVPSGKLHQGLVLAVKPGELILADGKVIAGEAEVDESRITGVPDHIIKALSDKVYAGTLAVSGKLYVLIEKSGAETYLEKLKTGFRQKHFPKENTIYQHRINSLSVLALFLTGFIYFLTGNKYRGVTMLLAAIPSAAGLALPAAAAMALGNAARKKIYIRDESIFSRVKNVDILAFDEIGTLAVNEVEIEDIIVLDKDYHRDDILRLASIADGELRPGLSQSIRKQIRDLHLDPAAVKPATNSIFVGDHNLMAAQHISLSKAAIKLTRLKHLGLLPVFVAVGNKVAGILALSEILRPQARESLERLRILGIKRLVLLTGDSQEAAEIIGAKTGINEVYGDLSVQQKANLIRSWKDQGCSVVMVGDGLDDALAMSEADFGICLGSAGINSSAQGAEIVIASTNLQMLVDTFRLLQKTALTGEENLDLALAQNLAGLGLGAAGLISPVGAGLLSNAAIITVLLNSMTI